jgi:hypothetical protein
MEKMANNESNLQKRERHLDIMQKYYIYKETKKGTQISDKNTVMKNRIFDTVVKFDRQQLAQKASLPKQHSA